MGVVTVVAPHTTPTAPAAIAAPFTSAEIAIVERIAADAKLAATTPNPSTTNTLIERFRRFVVGLLRRTGITVAAEAKKAAAAADRAGQLAAADDLLRSLEPFGPTNDRDVVVSAGVRLPELHDMILARATGMHAEVMRAASGMVGNPASAEIDRLALAQKMLNDFTSRGITAYVDRSGRRWSLTAYVEMSTRTALARLASDSYLMAAAAAGYDLVRVTVVPNCSPMCAPYQGGLLSIRGLSGDWSPIATGVRVPTVAEARVHGFEHPNCRHRMVVWHPGDPVPTPPAIDPADYENTQRLRALERALRAAKRQQAGALTPAAAQRATTRVRGLQARIRDHVDTTNAPRMRRRELVGAPR